MINFDATPANKHSSTNSSTPPKNGGDVTRLTPVLLVFVTGYARTSAQQCCGRASISPKRHLCCPGDRKVAAVYGAAASGCCGDGAYDKRSQICCNGVARELNGLAPADAVCCGDSCMNGSLSYCCKGQVYGKTQLSPLEFSELSCEFSPPM